MVGAKFFLAKEGSTMWEGRKIESVRWCWVGIGYTHTYRGCWAGRGAFFGRMLQEASLLKSTSQIWWPNLYYILKGEFSGFSERLDIRDREESRNDTKVFSLSGWSMMGLFLEGNTDRRAGFEEGRGDILSCLSDIQRIFWVSCSEFIRKVKLGSMSLWMAFGARGLDKLLQEWIQQKKRVQVLRPTTGRGQKAERDSARDWGWAGRKAGWHSGKTVLSETTEESILKDFWIKMVDWANLSNCTPSPNLTATALRDFFFFPKTKGYTAWENKRDNSNIFWNSNWQSILEC